ncbi:MAG: argininosuccinate lyase [Planctomycetota bacterium]
MTQKPWEHAKSSGSEGDPLAARFVSSLDYDKRLYRHDIAGSIAHARMLRKVELITDDDLAAIEAGLNEIKAEIDEQGDAWPGWRVELEDVHMCVEAALIEKAGDAGRKLHTGRSRNDQVATDLALWLSDSEQIIWDKCEDLHREFLELAEQYGHIVMPSYTHLQRAQPIVVGSELLAWAQAFHMSGWRMMNLASDQIGLPLGSGAIAGSSLPLDRDFTRQALELDQTNWSPSVNSLVATASRDMALDFTYYLSVISQWLSRWAEQWIIYATTEFGFITLDNLYTTGSSMMPQKQNPDMLELIRGKTGQVYGSLVALLTMCKGLTIGYNRDLQEDKRHVFTAYDAVCDCLDMAAAIVRTTTFNEERIKAGLSRGYLDATSLAEYLVTKGVPFRTSHQVVGALVQRCESQGLGELKKLPVEAFREAVEDATSGGAKPQAALVGEDVYDWLGAENVVKHYQTAGNAGVSGFEAQLVAWKERLGESS